MTCESRCRTLGSARGNAAAFIHLLQCRGDRFYSTIDSRRPRMIPPFRADHIGSLLRPKKLREAFRAHSLGKIPDQELRRVQDDSIREVIRLQEDCGLQVATDGEFRRVSYWEKFVRLTAGLEVRNAVFRFHDAHGHESDFTAPYVRAKVARSAPITLDEFRFVKEHTQRTPKITMPAPSTMHFYRLNDWGDHGVYRDASA